jgi:sRNA-binding regulator protein Hfq
MGMGFLLGLQEYLAANYHLSVFDQAVEFKDPYLFHLHGHRIVRATVVENLKYDIDLKTDEATSPDLTHLPKTDVKLVYAAPLADRVAPLLKVDQKVRDLHMEPIIPAGKRHHIKNKSLFPLMKERSVVFFTLMEGEIVKGLITGFSRYEITVSLKGNVPVVVLRHAVYDLRDKRGRCFLKSAQETHRDWERSRLFSPEDPAA